MGLGYEVCIHRDGRWEVYSFFDADEENDAIYQARDISNNYQAVCVLWPSEMRVMYFQSKNKSDKKPSYMDVRGDLKLASKKQAAPVMPVRRIVKEPPKEEPPVEKDPHFTREDQKKAIYKSVVTGFIGLFLTALIPALLSEDISSTLKGIIMFVCVMGTAAATAIVYQVNEQMTRQRNQEQDYEHDASWRKIGLTDNVLKKLKKEKSAEMKEALSQTMPSIKEQIEQATPKKEKNEKDKPSKQIDTSANSEKEQIDSSSYEGHDPQTQVHADSTKKNTFSEKRDAATMQKKEKMLESDSYKEKSQRIQDAIKAKPQIFVNLLNRKDNSDFKLPDLLQDLNPEDPEVLNAFAEASMREVLTEMCRAIKETSYDKENMELKENHEIAASLYLAGAASFMVKDLNLPAKLIIESVPLLLTRLDVNPEVTQGIMAQLSHYIHTPRHAVMFDRGVTDAKMRSENPTTLYTYENALNQWLSLIEESDARAFFSTILFTDIQNFTEQTQKNGDMWMIDVLHAHNDIMRQILASFGGQEIKHTGDGMLTTFNNIHKALHAAMTFQRGIDIFCKSMPSRKFTVRIGISAGDIISMDKDVFGNPVNLAARIMNKIEGEQIAISENVYGVVQESEFKFNDLGEVEMKGLDPQHIYSLIWREGEEPQETTNLEPINLVAEKAEEAVENDPTQIPAEPENKDTTV